MATTANEQQIAYWNQDAGQKWVDYQERLDRQIEGAGLAAMEAAKIAPGETVLDIGCGCGGTSLELARRVGDRGRVVGVDISAPMLARARERAVSEGLRNVTFELGDAQVFPFERGAFDLAFSRFGVMFFENPTAAFANIRAALRVAGRVCFACWRPVPENPWVLVPMMAAAQHIELPAPPAPGEPGPFAFADPDRMRGILSGAGFEQIAIEKFDMAMSHGETVDEAVDLLENIGPLSRALADASEEKKAVVLDAVREALKVFEGPDGVMTPRAMWIVRAVNPA